MCTTASAAPPAGVPAPDFALTGLDGTVYRLSEQLGAPVLLAYFATW
jgi:peroxiredoxin